ncbi:MAG TPA: protein-disulfide reductase DsbD domain-containing protein, partial [Roseimicrobium sp.]|nr:protein-disulfide reductase DsbD domain-containing protein [Roseimicrobium sp.]
HLTSMRWLLMLGMLLTVNPVFGGFFTPRTTATLVLAADQARPGDTILAGVKLVMPPKWHTYWQNPGDSGMATKITWSLPPGITAGEIQWPAPEKYTEGDLTTYILHDEATLLVPLTISKDATPGVQKLSAKVSWLECSESCIPGSGTVEASITIGSEIKPSASASFLEKARQKLPATSPSFKIQGWWESPVGDAPRSFVLELGSTGAWDFFPVTGDGFSVLSQTETLAGSATTVRLRKSVKLSATGKTWPTEINGVLKKSGEAATVRIALADTAPAGSAPVVASSAPAAGVDPAKAVVTDAPAVTDIAPEQKSFAYYLLYAFIGGIILNIMPCVLPVISLKILGFVQQSKGAPGEVRRLGLIYGLGVLVSFAALAFLIIAVKSAGKSAAWGMQFQNPKFLVIITTLVTLVALNLFGLFEVNAGSGTINTASNLAAKEGSAGAFFNGVFATILATPCTAPFLGTALGFAFAQPAIIILSIFLAAGAGLAAPYVLLSWNPAWLKFLPKPGAWMERFKIAMGFPMLAAAIWLFSLTFGHYGKATLWFGFFLVTVALAAWIYGEFIQKQRARRGLSMLIFATLLVGGYAIALEKELQWRNPPKNTKAAATIVQGTADVIGWQPWSVAAVEKARAEGRPVFVDFTADWCVTCQVNKKTSIDIPSVRAKLIEINAVALLGDYTQEDPAITDELAKFGRAGVPLVLVFPKDPKAKAIVLPEALTPGIVLDALNKAARTE